MNTRSQFQILNSPGKMMTMLSLRYKQIFEVPHHVQEYTKMRIPDKRYQNNTL